MTLVSAFAVLTVINMNLAKPKVAGATTLDMLEIMTRAFDESEGGEGGIGSCPTYSWGDLETDVMNNMCLGGPNLCYIIWMKNDVLVAIYFYSAMTEHEEMTLVCGEAVITPNNP